jgi:hypothetical protein
MNMHTPASKTPRKNMTTTRYWRPITSARAPQRAGENLRALKFIYHCTVALSFICVFTFVCLCAFACRLCAFALPERTT